MRVIDMFDRGAGRFPERAFMVDATGTRRYRETQALTHRIAAALLRDGHGPEAKVAVYAPNCTRAFECVLGIFRAGAVWVPASARNGVAENSRLLAGFDVGAVFFHSSFVTEIESIQRLCPNVGLFVCIDAADAGLDIDAATAVAVGEDFDRWLGGDAGPVRVDVPDAGAPVAIVPTGGTTGTPKGVVWTTRQFETQLANFVAAMPPARPPVHLVTAPLTHAAGCFALLLSALGATHVVLPAADPLRILEAIERERVTYLYLPPTLIYGLLAHPRRRDFDCASIEYLMYGAAPMAGEKLKEAIDLFGPVLAQTYGQMEAPGFCTFLSPADHADALANRPERLLSCGRATLLTEVEVMDDGGRLLPPGEVGEIVVRGGLVMQGYYRDAQATAEVSGAGWHHTGDLGRRDEDGYFYIVDRKKDMIISGGFNVFPSEIEQVLWSHAAVQDCAVVGVPDEKWGEAVKAVVELKPGATASEAELIGLCKARLGSVKCPKSIEFWAELPRTPVGKVRKKDIRQRYWEGRTRPI